VLAVDPAGGVDVGDRVADALDRRQIQRDAEVVDAPVARDLGGQPMAEQQVMHRSRRPRRITLARSVHPGLVPEQRAAHRLVQRGPVADPIAQGVDDHAGVLGEAGGRVAVSPAAMVLQSLGQVPVIEGQPGRDVVGEQLVDEAAVEVEATPLDPPRPLGLHPRPGDREPVRGEAQLRHEGDVLAVTDVVLRGHVTGVALERAAGCVAEGVPDRPAPAVDLHCPLDLVGGGGGAEDEPGRECQARDRLG
jgi:hypothetical protein